MARLLRTTAFRWTAAIAGWSTLLGLILAGIVYWRTAAFMQRQLEQGLVAEVGFLTSAPAEAPQRLRTWLSEDLHSVRFGAVFGANGEPLAGNLREMPAGLPRERLVQRIATGVTLAGRQVHEELWAAAGQLADGRTVVVAHDTDEVDRAKMTVLSAFGLALGPMLVLSVLGGMALAGRARRRVVAAEATLAELMQGDLSRRLPVAGTGDEWDRLAADVNALLDRTQQLMEEIRGMGNAIAHDLRTPLTRLRTRLERGRETARTADEFRTIIDQSLTWLDNALAMITAVLRIGEIEHGRRTAGFAPVDLAAIAAAAVELYAPVAEEKGLTLAADLARDLPAIVGDRDLIFEAVANLVDNAVKFTPAGGSVSMRLAGTGETVLLSVEDSGPGLPPGDSARLFQRFYRSELARSSDGHGLGLSLAAAVAKLHGFSLAAANRENGGARFVMICPAAPEASALLPGHASVAAGKG